MFRKSQRNSKSKNSTIKKTLPNTRKSMFNTEFQLENDFNNGKIIFTLTDLIKKFHENKNYYSIQ